MEIIVVVGLIAHLSINDVVQYNRLIRLNITVYEAWAQN